MSSDGSETRWLRKLEEGDDEAARQLYERYFRRLERIFSQRLGPLRRMIDGEDIAQSALATFFRGSKDRRFPNLPHRENLWHLLFKIADFKLRKRQESAYRIKRNVARQVGESALDQFEDDGPTPEFAAILTEQYDHLMDLLDVGEMQEVARLRLENFTNSEIAEQLVTSVRTVQRYLSKIRVRWSLEIDIHE